MENPGVLDLFTFLAFYPVTDQQTCLSVLDYDDTRDWRALLYQLRPLVRYKYITRRSDGLYSILNKGRRQLAEEITPLITCGGDAGSRKRAAKISRIAGYFYQIGIESCASIPEEGFPAFVPSPVWRNIREGIVSTSAFLGMLFYNGQRLAVYDIEDGSGFTMGSVSQFMTLRMAPALGRPTLNAPCTFTATGQRTLGRQVSL